MLLLATLIGAAIVLAGPRYFYRWQVRKDGVKERYWRTAGSWEIVGLGVIAVLFLVGMARG